MMLHATRTPSVPTMTKDPFVLLALIGASGWIGRRWIVDYRAALAGRPNQPALPGATSASMGAVVIASMGVLVILAAETGGEHVLGLSAGQSRITVLFGIYSILAAAVMEEVLFRGYLVIEHRGPAMLWAGAVLASMLFALLHPFLWQWTGNGLTVHFGAKAWFSTATVFAVS